MQITYLLDPLCGWCYGAGPAMDQLAAREDVDLDLAPTGLFAGDGARPVDAGFAAFAWQNDQRIVQATGQPFSDAYRNQILGKTGGTFDSTPATLGLVAVGLTCPGRELDALKRLQGARYVDGRDTSDPATVAQVLAEAGLDEAAQQVGAPDERLLGAARSRIEAARAVMARFGLDGVPALLVGEGDERRSLPRQALFGAPGVLAAHLRAA